MEDQPLGKDISQKEKRLTHNLLFSECIPRYFARENRYLYQEEPGIFSKHADQQSGTPIKRADQMIQHLYLVTKTKEKKKSPTRRADLVPLPGNQDKDKSNAPSFPASIRGTSTRRVLG